jgi:hypothetical protein
MPRPFPQCTERLRSRRKESRAPGPGVRIDLHTPDRGLHVVYLTPLGAVSDEDEATPMIVIRDRSELRFQPLLFVYEALPYRISVNRPVCRGAERKIPLSRSRPQPMGWIRTLADFDQLIRR